MATITLKGTNINTEGALPEIGSLAPDFTLTASDLSDVSLATYKGKKKILYIVPSLDTPTCALSTKKLNDVAKEHHDMVFLIISADLPFAMQRFCSVEKTEQVIPLSIMRSRDFARDYGVLIIDGPLAGITARAIVVLDEKDTVIHTELVSEIALEPNYEAAFAAL